MFRMLLSAALILFAPAVSAAGPSIWVYCGNLPGCTSGTPEFLSSVFALLIAALPMYVYIAATIFVMVGGARMVLSAGRDDWVTKGKSTITWAIGAVAVTVFSVQIVSMVQSVAINRVTGGDFILSVANTTASLIFDLLYITLLCISLFCGMWMVLSLGKEENFNRAKQGLIWAAVGAIVINLAEAIVNAFATL